MEANEIDQAVLMPRVSAGKMGAAPQLVQWRGGADGRVLAALNGTQTLRVRTSSINVASSRYAVSRILHFDARIVDRDNLERKQLGYRIGSADLSSFGTERDDRRAALDPLDAEAGGQRGRLGDRGVASHRRGRSDEIQVAWRFAGGKFSAIKTIADDRDRRRVDRRASGSTRPGARSSPTRATGSSRCG